MEPFAVADFRNLLHQIGIRIRTNADCIDPHTEIAGILRGGDRVQPRLVDIVDCRIRTCLVRVSVRQQNHHAGSSRPAVRAREQHLDALVDTLRDALPTEHEGDLGITHIDDLLIARYLGDSTETARNLFITLWKCLRPAILMRPPREPRIWST